MREIALSNGGVALVDDEFAHLDAWTWRRSMRGYAVRMIRMPGRGKYQLATLSMHHCITGEPLGGFEVDHINGDQLNNQRSNLRIVTRAQNMWNTRKRSGMSSRYKGVSWKSSHKQWYARIQVHGEMMHLGLYRTEQAAALAYDFAARTHYGEFARLNFPMEGEQGSAA